MSKGSSCECDLNFVFFWDLEIELNVAEDARKGRKKVKGEIIKDLLKDL